MTFFLIWPNNFNLLYILMDNDFLYKVEASDSPCAVPSHFGHMIKKNLFVYNKL